MYIFIYTIYMYIYTVAVTPKDETQKTNRRRDQKLVRTENEDELAPMPRS